MIHKASGLKFDISLFEKKCFGKGYHQTKEKSPSRQVVSKLHHCECWSYAEADQDIINSDLQTE